MRAVILGCGFAGLSVASALSAKSRGVEILMIDRRERFEYLPSLPEILSGKVSADEITGSLREFATKIGAEFLQREVKSVDFKAKEVVARSSNSSEERIPYDFLVVAVGAELAFFGIQGAEEHALSVYSLNATLKTRKRLEEAVQKEGVKCVVVGAGLTGVEVAGELVDFFSGRGCEASRVLLVEMAQRILPAFP
ncbi:MAG: FAD-dependent oxidoreductase, partial [Methanophagales archaeon]|nr:FAD-dependent oxidoreductase [Methanophagales archaeon]